MDRTRKRFPWVRWIAIAVAVVVVIGGLLIGGFMISRSRDFQLFGEIVKRVETTEQVVALTFDDGPTPNYTQGVLTVLAEKRVPATFFLTGREIEENPAEARAIVAAGHEVGNHSYSHSDMTLVDEGTAAREVERTDAAIRTAGYRGPIHFRAPFTKKLIGLPLYLAKHDRLTITTDVEPESYEDITADPRKIIRHVIEEAKPGSIILLHVMYESRKTSRQALTGIIDGLRAKGFRFVTVSELLALRDG